VALSRPDQASEVRRASLLLTFWVLLWSLGPLSGREVWFFHDLRHHHYPWRAWAARAWGDLELPFWAPVGHGFPLLGDGQAGLLYPPNLLLYQLLPEHLAFSWGAALHQAWAALGALFLARVLGRSVPAALVAGVAFGTSGLIVSHLVYLPMFQAMSWVPWMVAFAVLAVRRGGHWWVAAGFSIGLAWLCGHPQLALYGSYLTVFVSLWEAWSLRVVRGWRPFVGIGVMGLVALGVALPQLLATWELASLGARGGGLDAVEAAIGSLPPEELVNGVLPTAFGFETPADIVTSYHHRSGGYVGRGASYWEGVFYLGLPTVFLALAAGRTRRGRVWWVVLVLGLLVMVGPATPAFHLYRALPGTAGFRFPVRASVVVVLACSQLAALGIDRLGGWLYARPRRVGRRAMGVVAVALFALCCTMGASALSDRWAPPVREALAEALVGPAGDGIDQRDPEAAAHRAQRIVEELVRDVDPTSRRVFWPIGLSLVFASIWLLAARRRIPARVPGRLAWSILAIDLALFGYGFNPTTPTRGVVERPDSAVPLLGLPGLWRTTTLDRRGQAELDRQLLSANLGLLWGLEDVVVPSPLRLERNETYLARAGLGLGLELGEELVARFVANRHLVDLSGVRFLFTTHELDLPDLEQVWEGKGVRVYENHRALPRAFAVGCTHPVAEAEALDALVASDPAAVAVVEGPGLPSCTPGRIGEVRTTRLDASSLQIHADLEQAAWLVVTETRFPGQVVEVDGTRVESVPTDYAFQGLPLEAGTHHILVAYRPAHTLIAIGLSTLVWLVGLAWAIRTMGRETRIRIRARHQEGSPDRA